MTETNDIHPGEAPFLAGGGEMGTRLRRLDWAATALGAPQTWPQALRTLVALMLGSRQPMFVAWGPPDAQGDEPAASLSREGGKRSRCGHEPPQRLVMTWRSRGCTGAASREAHAG